MATKTESSENSQQAKKKNPIRKVESSPITKTGTGFFQKFNNDGVMVFSAALAYNVLTAILPIAIALLSIAGILLGRLDPNAQQNLLQQLTKALPGTISSSSNLSDLIFHKLPNSSSVIGIIAILAAIFGGSRLFVSIEYVFSIIYRVRQRAVVPQNVMAILMLLLFVILIPIMAFASSLPAIIASLLQSTLKGTTFANTPGLTLLVPTAGIVGSIIAGFFLFFAIYTVIPNQKINPRHSWIGSLLSAVLIEIYLALFPLYVSHFLSGYIGQVGFALILLVFFYYFAVILLLGAEINSFFSERIQPTKETLPALVHIMTNHLNTSEREQKAEANPSHRDVEPKDIRPRGTKDQRTPKDTAYTSSAQPAQTSATDTAQNQSSLQSTSITRAEDGQEAQGKQSFFSKLPFGKGKKNAHKKEEPAANPRNTLIEVALGTALTFIVELSRQRRGRRA